MTAMLWITVLCIAVGGVSAAAPAQSPFADAIAVWHMGDLKRPRRQAQRADSPR